MDIFPGGAGGRVVCGRWVEAVRGGFQSPLWTPSQIYDRQAIVLLAGQPRLLSPNQFDIFM